MSPLSFPGTDLGAVNHTGACTWGSEGGAARGGCADGAGTSGFGGYLEQQECAASNGLRLCVTLEESPATLVGPFSLAQERKKKEKGVGGGAQHKNLESNGYVSHLLHFLAYDWAGHLTCLILNFVICPMGIMTVRSFEGCSVEISGPEGSIRVKYYYFSHSV